MVRRVGFMPPTTNLMAQWPGLPPAVQFLFLTPRKGNQKKVPHCRAPLTRGALRFSQRRGLAELASLRQPRV